MRVGTPRPPLPAYRDWAKLGALAAAGLLRAAPAAAEDVPRVVLIAPASPNPTVARIRQELRVLRIEVDEVDVGTAGGQLLDLAEIARAHRALAVALVEEAPPAVVLWAAPEPRGGSGHAGSALQTTVAAGSEPYEEGLLALRAVELLRGRLIPVTAREGGTPGPPPVAATAAPSATPAPPATAHPSHPPAPSPAHGPAARLAPAAAPAVRAASWRTPFGPSVSLGPAVVMSPGGLGPVVDVLLASRFHVATRADVELSSMLPLSDASVSATEGTMHLRTALFGAAATGTLTRPSAPVFASAGLGVAAMALFFDADGTSSWVAASGTRWGVFPNARLGGGYRFQRLWAIRADVTAGVARPEPVLRIAGREVATFGEPAVVLSVGVELRP